MRRAERGPRVPAGRQPASLHGVYGQTVTKNTKGRVMICVLYQLEYFFNHVFFFFFSSVKVSYVRLSLCFFIQEPRMKAGPSSGPSL